MNTANQTSIRAAVIRMTGPLGPLGSLEERLDAQAAWKAGLGPADAPDLVALLSAEDQSWLPGIDSGEALALLAEAWAGVAEQDPATAAQQAADLLQNELAAEYVAEALEAVPAEIALPWLKARLQAPAPEELLLSVVGTLSTWQSPAAGELIAAIADQYRALPAVLEEIRLLQAH